MTYKDHLCAAMTELGRDPLFRVVGYNVTAPGGSAGGTLNGIPESQRIEMPLAEHNMASVAVGLSLAGLRPLLWIERMDFILNALDAIVNHLDKLAELSVGLHRPACIIRVALGKRTTPLFTEPTHCQDFTTAMRDMLKMRIVSLKWTSSVQAEYRRAYADLIERKSTMLVEDRDLDLTT